MDHICKRVLYVEDDEDDQLFFKDAIISIDPSVELELTNNGLQALDYLKNLYENRNELPCLVVLDNNMPYLDSKELVEKIKALAHLAPVKIFVITSVINPKDEAFLPKRKYR